MPRGHQGAHELFRHRDLGRPGTKRMLELDLELLAIKLGRMSLVWGMIK